MKENSIEKDEEILNNIKTYMQENIDKGYHKFIYNDLGYDEKCIDVINAIEHILSDYKRVLKENEELKNDYENLSNSVVVKNHYIKNSIPVQKVKDKKEELEAQYKIAIEENSTKAFILKCQITILQELIEEREEK